jgi:hypothetical protein
MIFQICFPQLHPGKMIIFVGYLKEVDKSLALIIHSQPLQLDGEKKSYWQNYSFDAEGSY